jgi:hypothetical protein
VFTGLAKVADEVGCPSYHSKSKNDGNFQDFKNGEINHLALAAMGKIGVTYPDLDSVILTNFTYNAEESSQILNRAIKLDYHGKIADLHILCLNEKPELKKINEYLTGGRKFGFTVWCMAQDYKSVPKIITRNLHYILMFKLNDNVSINNIIRNHNIHGIDKEKFKKQYIEATSEPRQFFMIDMKGTPETHLRHNFLDFLT